MIRRHRTFADAGALALTASILFAGLLSPVAAQAAPAAAPIHAIQADQGKSPVVNYVALGDSYAAGVGAGFNEDNACRQSSLSYPELLDDIKHVKLIADASCSGATSADILRQLSALKPNKDIDVVTVTVGANDLGGAGVVAACAVAFTSPECQNALAAATALMTPPAPGEPSELAVRLATTFAAVAAAAPDATILVTGYAYLFETPPTTDPNYATIVAINTATAALNTTIETAVALVAATGVDIRYVDVTDDLAGHGILSPDPWINASGPDAFHPTAAGYVAYAEAIRSEL
ncbi:SGNH/GDSL hydrolase family protein [Mycetocola sp. 2940]|uniref:SGNH/GDSL hydrolase family protein n=1 Tax=Mycetocola sp. 2940 TaxID=3156452 RepID=UPI00339653B6